MTLFKGPFTNVEQFADEWRLCTHC